MDKHLSSESSGKLMEAYFKHIGEAHVSNILSDLDAKKEEIEKTAVPGSLDIWFREFIETKKREETRANRSIRTRAILSKAAVIALVLITSMAAVTFTVKPVRARVFDFITKVFEKFTEVNVDNDIVSIPGDIKIDDYYYPTYLPKGYKYKNYEEYYALMIIKFTKGDMELNFTQTSMVENFQFDTENADVSDVSINGDPGLLIVKGGKTTLFWQSGETSFYMIGQLDKDEMIKMAKSMEFINKK